jgi:hypothetical protein
MDEGDYIHSTQLPYLIATLIAAAIATLLSSLSHTL